MSVLMESFGYKEQTFNILILIEKGLQNLRVTNVDSLNFVHCFVNSDFQFEIQIIFVEKMIESFMKILGIVTFWRYHLNTYGL